jgi:hypothetical protein
MQPKSRKKLQLTQETVRSLIVLGRGDLRNVVGGVSRDLCHSKDYDCTINPTQGGVTCNTVDSNCPSAGDTGCGC